MPTLLLYPSLGLAGEYQKVNPQAEFPQVELYADDLVLVVQSKEELREKVL